MQQTTTSIKISTANKTKRSNIQLLHQVIQQHYRSNFKTLRRLIWNLVNGSPPEKETKTKRGTQQLYLNKTLSLLYFHAALSPGQHDC